MKTLAALDLDNFPDSPYASELRRDFPDVRFSAELEREFQAFHLDRVRARPFLSARRLPAGRGGRGAPCVAGPPARAQRVGQLAGHSDPYVSRPGVGVVEQLV